VDNALLDAKPVKSITEERRDMFIPPTAEDHSCGKIQYRLQAVQLTVGKAE
jgi:hypothetical protein